MPLFKNEIIYLLKVYSNGEATYAEEQMLLKWVSDNDDKELIHNHLESILAEYKLPEAEGSTDWGMIYQNIKNKINRI